jgi:hypothetical protein
MGLIKKNDTKDKTKSRVGEINFKREIGELDCYNI